MCYESDDPKQHCLGLACTLSFVSSAMSSCMLMRIAIATTVSAANNSEQQKEGGNPRSETRCQYGKETYR